MTLKQLIKLEDKAKEVWVISPTLHYDTENKDFSELVSVNLGEKTKYSDIVPATKTVAKNLKLYKKMYKVTEAEIATNFLILPDSEFIPFMEETAIYNASTKCVACAAPATEDSNDVIRFNAETSKTMAKAFRATWKKFKRTNP
jgi:hypothetical protein